MKGNPAASVKKKTKRQVAVVAGASVLVGTQGAGLAQAVFLAQGAAVIEVDSNYCSPVLRSLPPPPVRCGSCRGACPSSTTR